MVAGQAEQQRPGEETPVTALPPHEPREQRLRPFPPANCISASDSRQPGTRPCQLLLLHTGPDPHKANPTGLLSAGRHPDSTLRHAWELCAAQRRPHPCLLENSAQPLENIDSGGFAAVHANSPTGSYTWKPLMYRFNVSKKRARCNV